MEEEEECSCWLHVNAAQERIRPEMEEEEEHSYRVAANASRERTRREEEVEDQRLHCRMLDRGRHSTRSASSVHYRLAFGGSYMWINHILGPWILSVVSVMHSSFMESPSTVVMVGKYLYILCVVFLSPYTIYLLRKQKKQAIFVSIYIHLYNSSLAFAFMGTNLDIPPGHGPYCYRIHCQIYHYNYV